MEKVLLNLDTLVVRPKIAIDGVTYEILSPDELPVVTSHQLSVKGKRLDALMASSELDADERTELKSLVREIADVIMEPVPEAIRRKLSDAQLSSVSEAFFTLLLASKAGTAAATLKSLVPGMKEDEKNSPSSTGAKSSRGSSGSTGASRAGGSTKRRSRS